jgi:hypothetical protein
MYPRKTNRTNDLEADMYIGNGHAEGNAKMKDVLGGKGVGLAEITLATPPFSRRRMAQPGPRTYTMPTSVHIPLTTGADAFRAQLALADLLGRSGVNPLDADDITDPRVRAIIRDSIGYVETLNAGRKAHGRSDLRKLVHQFVPRFVHDDDIADEALIGYPMIPSRRVETVEATGLRAGVFLLHDELDYHVLALRPPSDTSLYELPVKQYGTHRDVRALGRFTSAWLDKHGPHSVPGRMGGFASKWDLHVFCLEHLYLPMLERNDRRP